MQERKSHEDSPKQEVIAETEEEMMVENPVKYSQRERKRGGKDA